MKMDVPRTWTSTLVVAPEVLIMTLTVFLPKRALLEVSVASGPARGNSGTFQCSLAPEANASR